MMYNWSSWE